MSKLILDEKLTLEEKLTLFEKMTLDEAVNDLSDYPAVMYYIDKNDWARAFDEAKNNGLETQTVYVDNVDRLTTEQKNKIQKVAELNDFKVQFTSDDTAFNLIAEDASTVARISDLLNYLDGKNYADGKVKKVEKILSDRSTVKYNDDSSMDVAESVIDEYIEKNNVKNKLENSGIETFKQINMVLGLDKYDNPFLDFVDNIDYETVPLTSEHMTALSTLYKDKVISDEELNSKENSIVQNKGLYNNNSNGRDIVELVKTFKKETDENKKLFSDNKNIVLDWNTIKKKLYGNKETKKVDLRDKVWKLNKNFTADEAKKWYDKLTSEEKLNLRTVVH